MLHGKAGGVLTEEKGFIHQQLSGLFSCLHCFVLEVEAIVNACQAGDVIGMG